MLTRCLIFLSATALALSALSAHELEDGFVERAVEIVVRDNMLCLKYYVGLNENTMNDVISEWDVEPIEGEKETERIQRVLLRQLSFGLKSKIDGADVPLQPVGIEICPKHHFDFVAEYKLELPVDSTVKLEITDKNFLENDSAGRFALKARGSTMVSDCNVAPIVIRAPRIEFSGMAVESRLDVSTIIATVITPPGQTKKVNAPL